METNEGTLVSLGVWQEKEKENPTLQNSLGWAGLAHIPSKNEKEVDLHDAHSHQNVAKMRSAMSSKPTFESSFLLRRGWKITVSYLINAMRSLVQNSFANSMMKETS